MDAIDWDCVYLWTMRILLDKPIHTQAHEHK